MNFTNTFSGRARLQGLDILRAIAVFLVLGHHAAYRFPPSATDPIGQMMKYSGWIGVDIFFAISGFMITGILIRDQKRRDISGFFVRRFYRIVPLFGVAIVCFVASSLISGRGVDELNNIWSPALFLNGWTIPILGYENVPFSIAWSLSVEETAYILLGLACLGNLNFLPRMLIAFLMTSIILRWLALMVDSIDLFELYFFVPARLDSIALGGLGALGWYNRLICKRYIRILAGGLTFVLIWCLQYVRLQDPLMPIFGYVLFGLVCAVFVSGVAYSDAESDEINNSSAAGIGQFLIGILARFGKWSYFVYLFHLFILEGLLVIQSWFTEFEMSYWEALVISVAILYLLAQLSWRFFEFPLISRSKSKTNKFHMNTAPQPAED